MSAITNRPGNRMRKWLLQRHRSALVLRIYACLTVVMTWPVAGRLGTHIPASGGDAWVHLWTFWWVKQSVLTGHSPFYTSLLFYPNGVSLLYHNIAWVNIAAWLPLQALVGMGAAYSLIFMAIFTLNGFTIYLLAREVTESEIAAFVGGLVCGFWPYTLSHHNHPNLIFICWIPLVLLYLQRTLESGKKRDALLAALFLALIGLTRWQLLIMSGSIISLYLLYKFITDKTCRTPRVLGLLLSVGLVAGLFMTPFLAPVVIARLTCEHPEDLLVDEVIRSTDLLTYIMPNRYHPLWGDAALKLYENFGVNVNKVHVPIGYTTLLLAIYGTVTNWPKSHFWLLAALLYVILALGPELRIGGSNLCHVPMPYTRIMLIRQPERFNVLLAIPVAILASLGVATLCRSYRNGGQSHS